MDDSRVLGRVLRASTAAFSAGCRTLEADLPIFGVPPGGVGPGIRDVGLHLAIEERLDALGERDALRVAQIRVGFGIAVLVAADDGGLVALRQRGEDACVFRGRRPPIPTMSAGGSERSDAGMGIIGLGSVQE